MLESPTNQPGGTAMETSPPPSGTTIVKPPTSNNPTNGRTGPWYASIPIPQVQHPSLSAYTFTSKDLERQVFTHASAAAPLSTSSPASTAANSWFQQPQEPDNSTLQWSGASIVQSLCSIVLTSLYPALGSAALSDLRGALTAKPFHTKLSKDLRLPEKLRHQTQLPLSERIMAELFEAYVGAIARELGTEQFGKLHAWYYNLIEPYVEHYHKAYQNRNTAGIPTPTISSSESKLRRQNVAAYTSRLMEYAAKNKLEPPKFEFKDNGLQGAGIQWEATVSLGGAAVARATATTKLEAKHLASREALGALRDPAALDPRAGVTGGGQDRRRRKMERRMRGGAHGMQTPAVPHQQPLPSPWVQPPHIIPQIPSMPMQYPQHALPQITMATHQPMMNVYGQPTLPPHPPPGIM